MQSQKVKEIVSAQNDEEKELIEETYSSLLKRKIQEIQDITKTLNKIENETDEEKINNIKNAIDYFEDIINSEKPSKQILSKVLDKIIIYKNRDIEFKLKISIDKLI